MAFILFLVPQAIHRIGRIRAEAPARPIEEVTDRLPISDRRSFLGAGEAQGQDVRLMGTAGIVTTVSRNIAERAESPTLIGLRTRNGTVTVIRSGRSHWLQSIGRFPVQSTAGWGQLLVELPVVAERLALRGAITWSFT